MTKKYLVTGGAGFIGSAVVRRLINETDHEVLVIDKLTYAGNLESLASVSSNGRYRFERADIVNASTMHRLFAEFSPDVVMHLAAESHVDRSIDGPQHFVQTNIVGTFNLLQAALDHWRKLQSRRKEEFRFHHISTDEVFGSLGSTGVSSEDSPYRPNSPYSASKAASDHLVRAWHRTYDLPAVRTNCGNNYGLYQFPEKLIPLTIIAALEGRSLPVYGNGENIRDWLHVDDHAEALLLVARSGRPGEAYNIGCHAELTNIAVVRQICDLLDELAWNASIGPHANLITFVPDRPGHDMRYAMDASKIANELGWRARISFQDGLRHTVQWFLNNRDWWQRVGSDRYQGERLGSAYQTSGQE